MNDRDKARAYVSGSQPLPVTFSTAWQRDLDIAREMVAFRREARASSAAADSGDALAGNRDAA